MYQGLQVGQLTKLNLNPGGAVTGEMTVDPGVVNLLRDNTRIEMRSPKISLDNPNVSSLLTGTTLELVLVKVNLAITLWCFRRQKSVAATRGHHPDAHRTGKLWH